MRDTLLWLIRYYQRTLSPRLPPACRFQPSCSHYSYEALTRHGLWKGLALSVWRILRCNPLCRAGHDPVPVRRS